MLPLLREPMTIRIEPLQGRAKVGDVIVFAWSSGLVAHRVCAVGRDHYDAAGDAQPGSVERVMPSEVLGKVTAVYSSRSRTARQIDGPFFRIAGIVFARLRPVRAILRKAAHGAAFVRLLDARRRPRTFIALRTALLAARASDWPGVGRAIRRVSPSQLGAMASRHGCQPFLLDGITHAARLDSSLQPYVNALSATGRIWALVAFSAQRQLNVVIAVLREARVPFVLLKGAARLYRGEKDAFFQPIGDFDILVHQSNREAAISAFAVAGYRPRCDAYDEDGYRRTHHHSAPLFPAVGMPVELHTALAPPGKLQRRLDWDALAPYSIAIDGAAGPVDCLDDTGAAIHLMVHALDLRPFRDIVLLAELLRRHGKPLAQKLADIADAEPREHVRLCAAVAEAARLGGVRRAFSPRVYRYILWTQTREDLSAYPRERSEFLEAWFGQTANPAAAFMQVAQQLGPLHAIHRALLGAASALYGRSMRPL